MKAKGAAMLSQRKDLSVNTDRTNYSPDANPGAEREAARVPPGADDWGARVPATTLFQGHMA